MPESMCMDENDIDETFLPDNGENSDPTPLADDLLHFYKTFIVPDAGMTFILDSLVKHNVSGVPTSLYLLKKKIPRTASEVADVYTGQFFYIGIEDNLWIYFYKGNLTSSRTTNCSWYVP